jgi:hypothetical protein
VKRPPVNLPASIHRRLLNGAHHRGEDSQLIVPRYAAERFLYRLGQSPHRDKLVLKGALLFALWGGPAYRPTRDLDFTGYGSPEVRAVLDVIRDICNLAVADDGMSFDTRALEAQPIRDEMEYGGLRILFPAYLGSVHARMQIDIGFGNAIEPPPIDAEYPTLLDAPAPHIRAYPQEAVVAEKLHALVSLAERNSRYKDFYDLHAMALQLPFAGPQLTSSIAATFERRRTSIVRELPVALVPRFYSDSARAILWSTYLKRNSLPGAPESFPATGELIRTFLVPAWTALATGHALQGTWPPRGPWTAESREAPE